MFNPGETIVHQFTIPFIHTELSKVIVSYKQGDDIVFEKTVTSGFEAADDNSQTNFNVILSQEESLVFHELQNYRVQINVLTIYGTRASSNEIKGSNGAQYHKEVITP